MPLSSMLLAPVLLSLAPSARWDLTVELDVGDQPPPDHVCLVTLRPKEQNRGFDTVRSSFEELECQGWFGEAGKADCKEGNEGEATEKIENFTIAECKQASEDNDKLAMKCKERNSVEVALGALFGESPSGSCDGHAMKECAPQRTLSLSKPPKYAKGFEWAMMCNGHHDGEGPETVALLSVQAVELGPLALPYVENFTVIGNAIHIRFDADKPGKRNRSPQASVGVLGGHYLSSAALPSFGGRLRLPLRSECEYQRFYLPRSPQSAQPLLGDSTLQICTGRAQTCLDESRPEPDECRVERERFQILVPRPDELESLHVRTEAPLHEDVLIKDRVGLIGFCSGGYSRTCWAGWVPMPEKAKDHQSASVVNSVSFEQRSRDTVTLEPERIFFEWEWPCDVESSVGLSCPESRIIGGQSCTEVSSALSDPGRCMYSCPLGEGDAADEPWPRTVVLEQPDLGMKWSYALETPSARFVGTLEGADRRILPRRALLEAEPDGGRHDERVRRIERRRDDRETERSEAWKDRVAELREKWTEHSCDTEIRNQGANAGSRRRKRRCERIKTRIEEEGVDMPVARSARRLERKLERIKLGGHPWPGYWTERRGDELVDATLFDGDTQVPVELYPSEEKKWDEEYVARREGDYEVDYGVLPSISVPGETCREKIRTRYYSEYSNSRRYDYRDAELQWPYIDMPSPQRTAIRITGAFHVGAGIGVTLTGGDDDPDSTPNPLEPDQDRLRIGGRLYFAADGGWRIYHQGRCRSSNCQWPAVNLGLRYFGTWSRKLYVPLPGESEEPKVGVRSNWQHGPAVRLGLRYDRRNTILSRWGIGWALGPGWNALPSAANSDGRLPTGLRDRTFMHGTFEIEVHHRYVRATLWALFILWDRFYEFAPEIRGEPDRRTRPSFHFVPGFSIGGEL